MTTTTPEPVPEGLEPDARGAKLWTSVTTAYSLTADALLILESAARIADRIAALDAIVSSDGLMTTSAQGVRVHPAAVEARQLRALLLKHSAILGLALDEGAK